MALQSAEVHERLINVDINERKVREKKIERKKQKILEARKSLARTFASFDSDTNTESSVLSVSRANIVSRRKSGIRRKSGMRRSHTSASAHTDDASDDELHDTSLLEAEIKRDQVRSSLYEHEDIDEEDEHIDDGELGKSRLKVANHGVIVSYSSQDLRILSLDGQLLSRLEPSSIIEGVRAYSVSLYQVDYHYVHVYVYLHTHTHTHTHTYIYISIYMCVCLCVCVL